MRMCDNNGLCTRGHADHDHDRDR